MKLTTDQKKLIHIERACGDLRRGMAVYVETGSGDGVFVASPDSHAIHNNPNICSQKLIVSRTRASYLFPKENITAPMAINIAHLSEDEIAQICSVSPASIAEKITDFAPACPVGQSALKLAKIAELLPAIITYEDSSCKEELKNNEFLSVSQQEIESYATTSSYSLVEATRTKLNLKAAEEAEIVAYRPEIGAPEHYAIIVGKPGKEPLVRVHSSCYTGDLLASLSCDCRDQLQTAIEVMGKGEGGIILYLMQEGRGIGLVNKLRAYELKHNGMDTVEANLALGFDDDERLFLPAAEILRKLGISTIRLLTNNPLKATALTEHGIKVSSCVPHIMETNQYNEDYMQTKIDKMGHRI